MSKKILAALAVFGLNMGVAQASFTINETYDFANEIDYFMFDVNTAGSVDIVMDTLTNGFDADMNIWSKVTGSSVAGQPGDSEWAFVKWAPAAPYAATTLDPLNSYGISLKDNFTADPIFFTGVSDPGETLNMAVGTYLLTVSGSFNFDLSGMEAGDAGSVLSNALFAGAEESFFTSPHDYELVITGDVSATPSAVPVPAAVWLFGSALAGLGAVRRQKAIAA